MYDDHPGRADDIHLEPVYHIDENGLLAWTDEGLRTYRRRFAQFGIRIETITTYEDYRTALQRSAAGLQDQLLAIATDGPRS
ncbi:MAG: hypothetical protein IPK63_22985 [Candidatus Competibacteraceae bacterium]|nr:hypothetical protein [Candidatus Competibacteraceae bacterium]